MTREFAPGRFDVRAFALSGAEMSGSDSVLPGYPRLFDELASVESDAAVCWKATGESRRRADGAPAPWLHLEVEFRAPLTCQRCLSPVQLDLSVDRWFRFALDEAAAATEDEEAVEDVLAVSHEFDLHTLIEDELIMEIPPTPSHVECPETLQMTAQDADFDASEEAKPHPFAALGALRGNGSKAP